MILRLISKGVAIDPGLQNILNMYVVLVFSRLVLRASAPSIGPVEGSVIGSHVLFCVSAYPLSR